MDRLEWQIEKSFQQNEDIMWLIKSLENFCPFDGDQPKGLSPEFYQTLSYDEDKKLLDKFNDIKDRVIKC